MKQTKQRVIAIDYFRGVCILMVILNHGSLFTMPYAYLTGASLMWTSAAEMFLLLSGLTFGIVRGGRIRDDFKGVVRKTWRRAGIIYAINLVVVLLSLAMALMLTAHNLTNDVLGSLPDKSGLPLLWSIVTLTYGIGWASFLALYAVYMVVAPFMLYVLKTRFWITVPLASVALFVVNYAHPELFGYVSNFILWQLYFVLGLVLANFRLNIISFFYSLNSKLRQAASAFILTATSLALLINVLLNFNISPYVDNLVHKGLFPVKLEILYIKLLHHRTVIDIMFMNSRTGVLRPVITLLFLFSTYIIYQRYKSTLLSVSGKYINKLGSETLWVFVAQALAIPILAALPLPRSFLINSLLTATLIILMWQVVNRREFIISVKSYISSLRTSYSQAKYNYLSQYEDV